MRSERFRCAINTLHMMLVHERWYEAKMIVGYEIVWYEDPPPPGIRGGWQEVFLALRNKCKDRK